ncbi:MAG: helix-turn-helix domain-containing protein [Clostridia bacterium]|nr:helix-turn-helix domain-containing protein [Clostridia bacterium]
MDEKIIAERLRSIRIEHNLKQEDIARVFGLDRSAYSCYETGRTRISVKKLWALADIYNISLDSIVGREEKDEVTKVKIGSVASGVDPIALLDRDEQLVLMYYRLASEEEKKQIIDAVERIHKENETDDF